ncbi:class I SAM-dependent methyltransferase [Streptomyces sp. URMC 127]|uniref:class I SAM-dependent methyltransferase n=1 Tax=Streptomyces sp. URMC 127 TaxID=3423402 RepID=UPI003F1C1806
MPEDSTTTIRPEIINYYAHGYEEADRFAADTASAASMLEFVRIQELLRPWLPPPPAAILDVGGGPGAHARWLMDDGYTVHLVDPVPKHIDQARARGIEASFGDARHLDTPDHTYDAVLLLGPLYHLTERAERIRALNEAARAARPGALVAVAAMNRYSHFLDQAVKHTLANSDVHGVIASTMHGGVYDRPGLGFTTSYFHTAADFRDELTTAGLHTAALHGTEGPGYWILKTIEKRANIRIAIDSAEFASALAAARLADGQQDLLAVTAHLLAITHTADGMPQPQGIKSDG